MTPLVINDTINGDSIDLYNMISSNQQGSFVERMVTDVNGKFSSVNVAPGLYALYVSRNNQNIG